MLVYGALLLAIAAAFALSLARRPLVRVDVVRDRSVLSRIVEDGEVENLYRLQLMNATERAQRYRVASTAWPARAWPPPRPRSAWSRPRPAGSRWRCACRRARRWPPGRAFIHCAS